MGFWRILYYVVISFSFLVFGFLLVTKATGYRYNQSTHGWQKTGMLVMSVMPRDIDIHLDGAIYQVNRGTRIPNLLPGVYRISATKEGYQTWTQTITISPSFVTSLDSVNLFLAPPQILPTTPKEDQLIETATADPNLSLTDGELWQGSHLVSRFAIPPTSAILLPSHQHILYSLANQLRIIQVDGQNDQLVYERKMSNLTQLRLENSTTVLFEDGSQTVALRFQ